MRRAWSAVAFVAALAGCQCSPSGTPIDAGSDAGGNSDAGSSGNDGGADAGCDFVRVLFLVENSGVMCVADDPGTEPRSPGFCLTVDPAIDAGSTSGRVQALLAFQAAQLDSGVAAALAPFDVIPRPIPSQGIPYASALTSTQIQGLQTGLGTGSDLQGALQWAAEAIVQDMLLPPAELRARKRYEVVVLSDGIPSPRCSANDGLSSYADAGNPSGVWADTSPYCNTGSVGACSDAGTDSQGNPCIPGFADGGDRNQDFQLFSLVDELVGLAVQNGAAGVRVHTRLLFDSAAFAQCAGICAAAYNPESVSDARSIGVWTLQQIAARGNGTYGDPGDPHALSLSDLPLAPACPR
jgi:hypothetical protein